jgi:hypothetical protein
MYGLTISNSKIISLIDKMMRYNVDTRDEFKLEFSGSSEPEL